MKRIVVLGGRGFFGGAVVEALHAEGLAALVATRREGGDVTLDAEDGDSIARALHAGDVVIDAAGPFQRRTTRLIRAACEIGFDVIDLADHLAYVQAVYDLTEQIEAAGIAVHTACSSVSAVSAAMIVHSGIERPVRVTGFLVPATRRTAVAGTAASLLSGVGRTIEVLSDGKLAARIGWGDRCVFRLPEPVGTRVGRRFEAADAVTLPSAWPDLRQVDFFVDTNVLGLNTVLAIAAHCPPLRGMFETCLPYGLRLSRLLGREESGLAYEIEGADGRRVRLSLTSPRGGYFTAIAPAVLVAKRLARGHDSERGLVAPHRHVEASKLFAYLADYGIAPHRVPAE